MEYNIYRIAFEFRPVWNEPGWKLANGAAGHYSLLRRDVVSRLNVELGSS